MNGNGAKNGFDAVLQEHLAQMASGGSLHGVATVRKELVREWLDGCRVDGVLDAEGLCRKLSAFNRAVILAVLRAYETEYPWLRQCVFLEFGSGGRQEQVPGSDQDNGLLYDAALFTAGPDEDDLDDACQEIVVTLDGAGIPLCRGGVMISNTEWRGTVEQWERRLTSWLANPVEAGPWQSGMFLDFMAVRGAEEQVERLREKVLAYARSHPVVLQLLVQELTAFRIPLTFFGHFITEKSGQWEGQLDLKSSILIHITNAARIMSLKYGFTSPNTCDRLRWLAEKGHVSKNHGTALLRGWNLLQTMRIEQGIRLLDAGELPHSFIDPGALSPQEKASLKDAAKAAERFVRLVQAGAGL